MDEPLGLPKGSVRAILALLIVVAMLGAIFIGNKEEMEYLAPIMALIIGHYFGHRSKGA